MERVAFLIESTGERLGCLLNPDTVVMRRSAGIRARRSAGGELSGAGQSDDPLLYTGGGRTELELDLLFDVSVEGSTLTTEDVRDLTRPFWSLSENSPSDDPFGRPRLVRFVWGKSWNIPGVVAAVAERLEQFSAEGAPQRSWMRMRLVRVSEDNRADASSGAAPGANIVDSAIADLPLTPETSAAEPALETPEESVQTHEISGGGESEDTHSAERIDELTARYYGAPWLWRLIAAFNNIDDPLRLVPGMLLRIPPLMSVNDKP